MKNITKRKIKTSIKVTPLEKVGRDVLKKARNEVNRRLQDWGSGK